MTANIPPDDLKLALQLQREDLETLKKKAKGKGRAGETDDLSLAISLYEAEVASCAQDASDRAVSKSIARAVQQDADLIRAMLQEEEQAAMDREFARSLSGSRGVPTTTAAEPASSQTLSVLDELFLAKLKGLYVSLGEEEEEEHPAESSSWAASRRAPSGEKRAEEPKTECTGCGDKRHPSDVSRCPCSHDYCPECLASLFTASLSDESLFPPRCCGQPIPLDSCRAYLPSDLTGRFLAKKIELETPNRTYCHQPACSAFIPQQFVAGDVGTCPRCRQRTCVHCKGQSHAGGCPDDAADEELLRVAAENGWQRCHSCRRVVELDHGCNHMTCRCGAQFCYVCGLTWKTCQCAQWNEERLLARADEILNRDVDPARLDEAERANRLERERQNLMVNHECEHRRWRSRGGSHRCEECYDVLPLFIYECVQCRIMACRRCRFNRL